MISPLNAKLDRKWIEASQRITSLEEQLAACQQERDESLRVTFNPKVLEQLNALEVERDDYRAALERIASCHVEQGMSMQQHATNALAKYPREEINNG